MKNKINGAILEDLNCYLYPIIGFDNYRVTDNGNVYKIIKSYKEHTYDSPEEVEPIESYIDHGNLVCDMVADNGKECKSIPIAKLLISSRIGDLNLPIVFKNGNHLDVKLKNLYYDFQSRDIQKDEEHSNVIYIVNYTNGYKNEFREDPLRPGYFVSDEGAVYNSMKGVFMTRSLTYAVNSNYYRVSTKYIKPDTGEYVQNPTKVHQMVYRAWVGLYDGYVIDHINAHKYDNRISNLEKVTPEENSERAHATGLTNPNFKGKAKYSKSDINVLCQMIDRGASEWDCYNYFVNKGYDTTPLLISTLIRDIKRGVVHKAIASKYNFSKEAYQKRVSDNENLPYKKSMVLRALRRISLNELTIYEAAKVYGLSRQLLYHIIQGHPSYRHLYENDPTISNYIMNIYPENHSSYFKAA